MWMGVPALTLSGDHFVSRMGVTHLATAGLPELIADSEDAYVEKAIALARQLEWLATLRSTLRQRMLESPLCDAARFTRSLEAAYRAMWHNWCLRQEAR